MKANITTITANADGTVNVSIEMANGYTDGCEGLYNVDSGLRFSRMVLSYQMNKYIRR